MNGDEETPAPEAGPACVAEWVNLPGLFSWEEVCVLFSNETGHDDGWRFHVHRASSGDATPLYAVRAARRPAHCREKGGMSLTVPVPPSTERVFRLARSRSR